MEGQEETLEPEEMVVQVGRLLDHGREQVEHAGEELFRDGRHDDWDLVTRHVQVDLVQDLGVVELEGDQQGLREVAFGE